MNSSVNPVERIVTQVTELEQYAVDGNWDQFSPLLEDIEKEIVQIDWKSVSELGSSPAEITDLIEYINRICRIAEIERTKMSAELRQLNTTRGALKSYITNENM